MLLYTTKYIDELNLTPDKLEKRLTIFQNYQVSLLLSMFMAARKNYKKYLDSWVMNCYY